MSVLQPLDVYLKKPFKDMVRIKVVTVDVLRRSQVNKRWKFDVAGNKYCCKLDEGGLGRHSIRNDNQMIQKMLYQ